MANKEHLAILNQGVEVWNKWREENPGIIPDLRDADLHGVHLQRANLHLANLFKSNLSKANLHLADLGRADLELANLKGADLSWANLYRANLANAILNEADMTRASFIRADLNGVAFSGAQACYSLFANVDLSGVIGLDTVVHQGPSTIGTDTLYLSRGKIPVSFLRGAGVPDNLIEYTLLLVGKSLRFYSCFISYSSKDQEFADRLYADLQAKGVRCWFAPHDIQGGKKLHEQIDRAIWIYDKLLLILSADSMQSTWVNTEIYNARQREIGEKRHMLFPVSLVPFTEIQKWTSFDADSGKDLGREIREYYIPDFSNWKDHDSYQKAFDRLLQDLKAE